MLRELLASGTGSQLRSLCKNPLEDKCSGLGGEGPDDRRAEALFVKHCRQSEQARGGAATAAASDQLTRRRGVLLRAWPFGRSLYTCGAAERQAQKA